MSEEAHLCSCYVFDAANRRWNATNAANKRPGIVLRSSGVIELPSGELGLSPHPTLPYLRAIRILP